MRPHTTYHEMAARYHAQHPYLSLSEVYRRMAQMRKKKLVKSLAVTEYQRRLVRMGLD